MIKRQLLELGFTANEAVVYEALLDHGPCGAGVIIRRTALHRNIVYENLDRLVGKKLAEQRQHRTGAIFQATHPRRLVTTLSEERDAAEARLRLASTLLPSLEERAAVSLEIVVHEGTEAFRAASFASLERARVGATFYVLGSLGQTWYDLMGPDLRKYMAMFRKKRIHARELVYGANVPDAAVLEETGRYEFRIIDEAFVPPANTIICGDNVALQIAGPPPIVISLENAALGRSYLHHFDLLWRAASKPPRTKRRATRG